MSWVEDNSELLEGFVSESRDALDSINPFFIEIIEAINEKTPVDTETLNGVFRLFHTMKGSAGFLNLNILVQLKIIKELWMVIREKILVGWVPTHLPD